MSINVLIETKVMKREPWLNGKKYYDTDPVAALEVFAKFPGATIERTHDGYWVSINGETELDESLPLAICKVALRAKGVSVEEIKEALK